MASRKALATIIKLLEHTTTKPVPEESWDTWLRVLAPLDDDLAVEAAMRVVRHTTKPFAVPPGAIFTAAEEILAERYPSEGEAWELARQVARGERTLADLPLPVRRAAEQVGLFALREVLVGDGTTRAHFLQFYREARRQTVNREALGKLEQRAIGARMVGREVLGKSEQEALKEG